MADVFFYVQHLLGIGHLRRCVAVANGLARAGISVQLVSGGNPVTNLGIIDDTNLVLKQLPPVRARDGNFTDLVDEHNNAVDEKWWDHRRQRLMDVWTAGRAPILITESYPFARRMMRPELLPLLRASAAETFSKINICSVRDIPQPKSKPERAIETGQILGEHYNHVLVHGDKSVAVLQETFPGIEKVCGDCAIHYTGYVDIDSNETLASQTTSDVLVSAGGGAAGLQFYCATLDAAKQDSDRLWRILVGPNVGDEDYSTLLSLKTDNVIIERNRADFRSLLQASTVSISQAGYNTLVDILRTDVASVLVPYAKGQEREQTMRARKFSASGRVVLLNEESLDSTSILRALDRARQLHDRNRNSADAVRSNTLRIDGVAQTVKLVRQCLSEL